MPRTSPEMVMVSLTSPVDAVPAYEESFMVISSVSKSSRFISSEVNMIAPLSTQRMALVPSTPR